jgi:hypothetical protein
MKNSIAARKTPEARNTFSGYVETGAGSCVLKGANRYVADEPSTEKRFKRDPDRSRSQQHQEHGQDALRFLG